MDIPIATASTTAVLPAVTATASPASQRSQIELVESPPHIASLSDENWELIADMPLVDHGDGHPLILRQIKLRDLTASEKVFTLAVHRP